MMRNFALSLMAALLAGSLTVGFAQEEEEPAKPETWEVSLAGSKLTSEPMLRGFWIASWGDGILTPEQCEQFVQDVRDANMNAIFPEVRKVGDAYYLDGLEPRASNIGGSEDFDPLGYLIELCHDTSDGKQYIEVHAWLVTFRIWRDEEDPPAGHLLSEYPDVVMSNADGETVGGSSVFADPGHPRTEEWTAKVFRDVAERYDIDGIHHDYVRYPEYDSDWGHNPVSLERFRERTGFEGTPEPDNPMWQAWRREQVENTVRRVYAEVMEVNPDCVVSAATLNWALEMDVWEWQESSPRLKAHQDWVRFMKEGTLDANVLMSYADAQTQPHRFNDWNELAMRTRFDRHAYIGPGIYKNTIDDSLKQIWQAMLMGADGVNLYSYGGTNSEDKSKEAFLRRLSTELFTEKVPVPERPWKDDPNYGLVLGQVFDEDGEWVDGASVILDGVQTMLTDGTGFYAFTRVAPGEHVVRIREEDGSTRSGTLTVEAGKAARLNFGEAGE